MLKGWFFKKAEQETTLVTGDEDEARTSEAEDSEASLPSKPAGQSAPDAEDGASIKEKRSASKAPGKRKLRFPYPLFATAVIIAISGQMLREWTGLPQSIIKSPEEASRIWQREGITFPILLQLRLARASFFEPPQMKVNALYDLGCWRLATGDQNGAIRNWAEAVPLTKVQLFAESLPENAQRRQSDSLRLSLCRQLLEAKRYDEAVQLVESWKKFAGIKDRDEVLSCEHANLYELASKAYRGAGMQDKAERMESLAAKCNLLPADISFSINAKSDHGAQRDVSFQNACECLVFGRLDKAEQLFTRLVELYEQSPEKGWSHDRKLHTMSPDDPRWNQMEYKTDSRTLLYQAYMMLFVSQVEQKNWKQAERSWSKAIAAADSNLVNDPNITPFNRQYPAVAATYDAQAKYFRHFNQLGEAIEAERKAKTARTICRQGLERISYGMEHSPKPSENLHYRVPDHK